MRIVITGGAGFIGSHLALRLSMHGHSVIVLDDLSRHGSESNLSYLKDKEPDIEFIRCDIRDASLLKDAVKSCNVIFHLASQVAVTTSLLNPREDFEINALGTLNILEAARLSGVSPIVIYASTNKVYGSFDAEINEEASRYTLANLPYGINERQPLAFHSPYGCSKGCGDQYVLDYARIYGLPTVVFRQSCIYGERQFGVTHQGWLAHFLISAALDRPIDIFGDGKQTRDVLHVDDLVDAYELAIERIDHIKGNVYNIGGGPDFTLSVWLESSLLMEEITGRKMKAGFKEWRAGDQKVYVSDIRKACADLSWKPKVPPADGLERLWRWVNDNTHLLVP